MAVAIRGYAPEPPGQAGVQVVTTTARRWPAYAWSFPLGDGRANVGYGELVSGGVTRAGLVEGLHRLLPGVDAGRACARTGCRCRPAARGCPTGGCCSPATRPG